MQPLDDHVVVAADSNESEVTTQNDVTLVVFLLLFVH